MRRVYPIEERCINCHLCEVACTVEHSKTKSPLGAYHVEALRFNWEDSRHIPDPAEAFETGVARPLTRTVVHTAGYLSISTTCRHCKEPDCVLACKNGSLYQGVDGRVLLHEEKCVGCWMCIMACRYGAITRNPSRKNVPAVPNRTSGMVKFHCL